MLDKKNRIIFLYEFKLGHNASEACRNINEAFGEGTTSDRTVRRWFERFRSGDMSLEDEEGRGRPSEIDNDQLIELVESNPQTTIRELALDLDVSISTISRHLQAIGKVKKLDKWVPHDLNEKQEEKRLKIASLLSVRNQNEPFLDRIVTCDEKWILYDNRQRSGQWLDVDEPPKHMPKPNRHPKKTMLTIWWCRKGVIHYEFLKKGETINAEKYVQVIDRFHKKLKEMWPALTNRKGPLLLHDNARPHTSKITTTKLNQLGVEVLPHPPYSPDLAPTDYHLFKHLASFLSNKIYENQTEVENDFNEFIASRDPTFYSRGIDSLLERWRKCIDSNGKYFD